MCGIYVLAALVILVMNIGMVPEVVTRVVTEAFKPQAVIGGGLVAVLIQGIKRGVFFKRSRNRLGPHCAFSRANG